MEQRIGWEVALASLSLAFALSVVVAWVYSATHAGLSYLRGFTQSLAMGGIISAVVLLAIGDDVARGLGVVGALTIVRFRTTVKDARDLMFVFASLAAGVACGVQSYAIAIVGTGVFTAAAGFLHFSSFGTHRQFDAVLRIRMPVHSPQQRAFIDLLEQHCRRFILVNLRESGNELFEHSYQVQFSDPKLGAILLSEVNTLPGLTGATLLMQDSSLEL
ncbi:MAG TPA: DUF4956 domain-containing protein [Polyangia bacterium]|nr:DUF4956 domain-containing protein [Polyangia bacterium]